MRAYGAELPEIAAVLNQQPEEVAALFREALLRGEALARGNLISRLFERAMNGNAKALIELHRLLERNRTR
jgi:hypothetical protein